VAALPTSTITSTPPPTETSAPTATQQPTQAPTATLEPAATEVPLPTATPTLSVTPVGGGLGEIAFASDRTGSVQVWIMGSDGSNARQITNLGDGACQPDWSPDGQRLVFISPCSDKKEDYPGASMFLINADGTGLFPLASMPGGDFDPAWSPDGAQIAFTSLRDSGWPHIFLYNLADNKVKRLSSQTTRDRQAAWSPDGSRIAYGTTRLGNPQIWTMAVDGSGAHEFSKLEGSYEFSPAWAPDNSMIIYSQGNSPMLIARPWGSGTAAEFTISDTIRPVDEARFSKDGWWLAFTDKVDNNFDIYIMKWNAASLTRLTTSPGLDFHPSWRP
jgi:Tol biopolymer transport system component